MDIFFSRWKPQWRAQFRAIQADLANGLTKNQVSYLNIEHVGSTSIAHIVAKPMIDILIVVADADFNDGHRERLKEVLCWSWDLHHGGYLYKGESSIRGRWNFSLQGVIPERKIAVVAENSIYRRSCLALRDKLKIEWALREEYGRVKLRLARTHNQRIMQYSTGKNEIVRKILKEAGWTDEEVDEKEGMVRTWYLEL